MPVIPALWEADAGGSLEARSLRPVWSTWRNPVFSKSITISQVWWCVSIVLDSWDAMPPMNIESNKVIKKKEKKKKKYGWEAGHKNRLKPGGRGCSKLRSHHCTPAWVTEQDPV